MEDPVASLHDSRHRIRMAGVVSPVVGHLHFVASGVSSFSSESYDGDAFDSRYGRVAGVTVIKLQKRERSLDSVNRMCIWGLGILYYAETFHLHATFSSHWGCLKLLSSGKNHITYIYSD